jgi:hypothetical protein
LRLRPGSKCPPYIIANLGFWIELPPPPPAVSSLLQIGLPPSTTPSPTSSLRRPPREQPRPVPLTSGGGPVRRAHLRRRSPPARSPPAVAPSGAAHLRRRPVRRGSPRTWPLRRGNPFWWQPPPATTPPPVRIGILVPLTRYRDLSTWTVYLFPAARDEITNTNCYWFLKKHHGLVSALPALPFQVDM